MQASECITFHLSPLMTLNVSSHQTRDRVLIRNISCIEDERIAIAGLEPTSPGYEPGEIDHFSIWHTKLLLSFLSADTQTARKTF